ncbi:Enolase domain-containing protein [Artemisia annua]|uniref:Enolase domain-containing protein n=1 Tax=Artemisia annua TaxID=35608 RepID=A0A2U1M3I2_ARTAN|nr:Enolase domain-containing protein [Artemisia annua]
MEIFMLQLEVANQFLLTRQYGANLVEAVDNVNSIIARALIGKDPTEQTKIDNFMVQELDETLKEWGWCKQKLAANAILAVSLAVCKAGATVMEMLIVEVFVCLKFKVSLKLFQEQKFLETGKVSFRNLKDVDFDVERLMKEIESVMKPPNGAHADGDYDDVDKDFSSGMYLDDYEDSDYEEADDS